MRLPVDLYAAWWKAALRLTARSLKEQTYYMRRVSQSSDPASALLCHEGRLQRTWTRTVDEGSRLFKSLQTGSLSSSPQ